MDLLLDEKLFTNVKYKNCSTYSEHKLKIENIELEINEVELFNFYKNTNDKLKKAIIIKVKKEISTNILKIINLFDNFTSLKEVYLYNDNTNININANNMYKYSKKIINKKKTIFNKNEFYIHKKNLSYIKRIKKICSIYNYVLICFLDSIKINKIYEYNKYLEYIKSILEINQISKEEYELLYTEIPTSYPKSVEKIIEYNSIWPINISISNLKDNKVVKYSNEYNKLKSLIVEYIIKNKFTCIIYNTKSHEVFYLEEYKYIKNSKNEINNFCNEEKILNHSVFKLIEYISNINCNKENVDSYKYSSKEYLLNNMILISIAEPCIMCTFSLVHSRIKKVFFIYNNLKDGGIESVINFTNYNSINHKFLSYKIKII